MEDIDRLRKLEKESEEWARYKRPLCALRTQCPDFWAQEDREREIRMLENNIFPWKNSDRYT